MKARVPGLRMSPVLFSVLLSIEFFARTAAAVPPRGALVVASGPACQVLVTKVSYDDPGADDAEFIELRVERTIAGGAMSLPAAPCLPPPSTVDASGADSGGPEEAGAGNAGGLTLGDCGLASLELVNGGAGACEIYRLLPLATIPVPADNYVTFCATDSTLADLRCDVMAAGRSALRNGWLQNGGPDGLRFRAEDGSVALELTYEGPIGCFGPDARPLVEETGEMRASGGADPLDDVNAFCGDAFVHLPPAAAPLRGDAQCPPLASDSPTDTASSGPGLAGEAGAPALAGLDASPWGPERAPAARPKGPNSIHAALGMDAGLVAIARMPSAPPKEIGCSMTRPLPVGPASFSNAVFLLVGLLRRARRKVPG